MKVCDLCIRQGEKGCFEPDVGLNYCSNFEGSVVKADRLVKKLNEIIRVKDDPAQLYDAIEEAENAR